MAMLPAPVRASSLRVAAASLMLLLATGCPASSEPRLGMEPACPAPDGDPGGADGWGSCWPGPGNTGVPAGRQLIQVPADTTAGDGWTWNGTDRIVEITGDGSVIDGLEVDGGMYVRAIGVTILDSKARFVATASGSRAEYCHLEEQTAIRELSECTVVPGLSDVTASAYADPRTVIEDSEIAYRGRPGDAGTCITGRNLSVARVNVHGCENGFDADSYVSVTDSYVHDLYNSAEGDPHTDGLQSGVGRHIVLEHNVIFAFSTGCVFPDRSGSCNGTAAVNIGGQPDLATVSATEVTRNLLAGGAYTIYCPMVRPAGFRITENRFSTVFSQGAADPADRERVGAYGVQSGCEAPGITAKGNALFRHRTKGVSPLAW
jgi:hypothetical protein